MLFDQLKPIEKDTLVYCSFVKEKVTLLFKIHITPAVKFGSIVGVRSSAFEIPLEFCMKAQQIADTFLVVDHNLNTRL